MRWKDRKTERQMERQMERQNITEKERNRN